MNEIAKPADTGTTVTGLATLPPSDIRTIAAQEAVTWEETYQEEFSKITPEYILERIRDAHQAKKSCFYITMPPSVPPRHPTLLAIKEALAKNDAIRRCSTGRGDFGKFGDVRQTYLCVRLCKEDLKADPDNWRNLPVIRKFLGTTQSNPLALEGPKNLGNQVMNLQYRQRFESSLKRINAAAARIETQDCTDAIENITRTVEDFIQTLKENDESALNFAHVRTAAARTEQLATAFEDCSKLTPLSAEMKGELALTFEEANTFLQDMRQKALEPLGRNTLSRFEVLREQMNTYG